MFGTVSEEVEAKAPASEAWKLYSSLHLARILANKLPSVVSKIDILEGDGGPGTLLQVSIPPGLKGGQFTPYKEYVTMVDEEKGVREAEVVEGGYLDLGFTRYMIRVEVKPKDGKKNECIMKHTIEYELKKEYAANAALVSIQPYIDIMEVAADYLNQNYNNN